MLLKDTKKLNLVGPYARDFCEILLQGSEQECTLHLHLW